MTDTGGARALLAAPAPEVAPRLLGWHLVHESAEGPTRVRITETEAYEGAHDPASHAHRGRTGRTAAMFGPAGHAYVYRSYGIHLALNVVTGTEGSASAVLLRAGEVVEGQRLAARRRGSSELLGPDPALARGPGNLGSALGLDPAHDGLDLLDPGSVLRIEPPDGGAGQGAGARVGTGPRVGVSRASGRPWRFWVIGDPSVSAYRRSPRATDET